ncbi:unnamed protein product [Heligmosomoides polygyrus]|uniref:Uncharacterized protein n=1 Tax=Heligmosomoides polygyrus TaxID=6339 RepID=A0A183FZE8_HELPZ|nr:unnamed protein product [Heligmosomoides polygyrus]
MSGYCRWQIPQRVGADGVEGRTGRRSWEQNGLVPTTAGGGDGLLVESEGADDMEDGDGDGWHDRAPAESAVLPRRRLSRRRAERADVRGSQAGCHLLADRPSNGLPKQPSKRSRTARGIPIVPAYHLHPPHSTPPPPVDDICEVDP